MVAYSLDLRKKRTFAISSDSTTRNERVTIRMYIMRRLQFIGETNPTNSSDQLLIILSLEFSLNSSEKKRNF